MLINKLDFDNRNIILELYNNYKKDKEKIIINKEIKYLSDFMNKINKEQTKNYEINNNISTNYRNQIYKIIMKFYNDFIFNLKIIN